MLFQPNCTYYPQIGLRTSTDAFQPRRLDRLSVNLSNWKVKYKNINTNFIPLKNYQLILLSVCVNKFIVAMFRTY
jgi:hypothetical protein